MLKFLTHVLITAAIAPAIVLLPACSKSPSNNTDDAVIETIEAADIAAMKPAELMSTAAQTVKQITSVLTGVTDESSAQIATKELAKLTPQFQAMAQRLETFNEDDIGLSMSIIRATAEFGQSQIGLMTELTRISEDHPDLADTLSHALDDLEF